MTAFVAKPLIRVWVGPAAVSDTSLILSLSVYNLFGVMLMATGHLLVGVERVNALAASTTLCALGTIGLGIVFARWTGHERRSHGHGGEQARHFLANPDVGRTTLLCLRKSSAGKRRRVKLQHRVAPRLIGS
jgi:hypothetical protein